MGLILKLLLLAYALDSSSQSTTESLTFQTERECVSNGGILLDGDSLILYFDYGFNSSVVVSLRCSRGGDIMLTSIGESKTVTDVFAGRVTFDFNETGIIVNMIASVQEGDSDIATFQCEVVLQLSTGSLISRSATATITSQQYGNITQQDVSGRINLLNEQIYELPSIITVQTKTGGGLFECMPASLVDVKDDSGAVMCTGVTSGSNSFCNFTLGEEDISDQENKTFTACATLYDTDACKSISVFYNDTRPDGDFQTPSPEPPISPDDSQSSEKNESFPDGYPPENDTPSTSTDVSSTTDDGNEELAFLAIPGGIIAIGIVIGIIYVVANSANAGATGTVGFGVQEYYSGAYQGLGDKVMPYYVPYDYKDPASVYYESASRHGRSHNTSGSKSSRSHTHSYGYSRSNDPYISRGLYNSGNMNRPYGVPRYQTHLPPPQHGANYVLVN